MTIDEMIAVLQAAKDGKQIQFCEVELNGQNWTNTDPAWNFHEFDYRVKPTPPDVVWFASGPFIKLTPAVRAACEAAGIELPEVQDA